MVIIRVGDDIPLVLFLQGKDIDLYPQAVLRQSDGVLISTVDLTHQDDGIYVNGGLPVVMPDTEFVTIQYTVYTDVARTIEALRYNPTIDTFAVMDINVTHQNDAQLYGSGAPGDKWRGYL